ncbi:hypothetical protein M378DRAFT_173654 [Amanita muscaria Koide BX008]|uniref:Uncharacterized protein n=1 Tax=Amanita muscaria (strain Koide BX008) TaxID=946122 RepID=A0A0C2WH09_AMAMK|nr:hypothetical protein M378DRAFT_173654 [Amanita muscaria Koide BX008]
MAYFDFLRRATCSPHQTYIITHRLVSLDARVFDVLMGLASTKRPASLRLDKNCQPFFYVLPPTTTYVYSDSD